MKKFISAITAISIMLTSGVTVQAETADSVRYIDINGYDCYERDGYYWTVIDGIEYLVIDLSDSVSAGNDITTYSSPMGTPPNWANNQEVTLTESSPSYTDTCNLKNGDYCSPIYKINPKKTDYRISIYSGVWLNNTYDIEFYTHLQYDLGGWHMEKNTITFNVLLNTYFLLTGTPSTVIDGFALRFLSSSTGQKDLDYKITAL